MTKIEWDQAGERLYETGVDRGVFYPKSGSGVPWTGLTSVSESSDGGGAESYYIDGIKYLSVQNNEDFIGTINAIGSPKEFSECDGRAHVAGLFISNQPRKTFDFTYRTNVNSDTNSAHYKLHIVYNVLVSPTDRDNTSISDSISPMTFSWSFTTTPEYISGYKPTSHFIIDSLEADYRALEAIERMLYGTAFFAPRIPTATELVDILGNNGWNLAPNPSFETQGQELIVYENLAKTPRPDFRTWACHFGNGGASGTSAISFSDARFWSGTSYWMTWTSAPATSENLWISPTNGPGNAMPVFSGWHYWVSMQYATNWPNFNPQLFSSLPGEWSNQTVENLGNGTFVVQARFIPLDNGDSWFCLTSATPPPNDVTLGAGSFAVYAFGARPPFKYHDGIVSADGGLDFSSRWTGEANNSTSIMIGHKPSNIQEMYNCAAIQSAHWTSNGSKSLRLIPTGSDNASEIQIFGWNVDDLKPGHTYTATAKCRLESIQTGELQISARALAFVYSPGEAKYYGTQAIAPNLVGEHLVSLTFTVPIDAVNAFLRVTNGASVGGGDVWWDDLQVWEENGTPNTFELYGSYPFYKS